MNITRDVILDLLPLCHAGEASDDTHKLVAAYAASDAEIARLLAAPPAQALPETPYTLDKENEMQTLEKTRAYMQWHTILLGGAVALTFFAILALASIGVYLMLFEGASRRLMVQAAAGGLVPVLMAAAAWTGYFLFRFTHRMAQ